MNKKGFTLIELIFVVVILGIISVITIPSIMESLAENKKTGGESIEKLLENNLKLYNTDKKEDLWCLEDSTCTQDLPASKYINPETLFKFNPDINLGDCTLITKIDGDFDTGLKITMNENGSFTYAANIKCEKSGTPGTTYYKTNEY